MLVGVFDVFKPGVGPSSSHTMGPMVAAFRFIEKLKDADLRQTRSVQAVLYGSLAYTGKGHGTDRAIILGLMGFTPDAVEPDAMEAAIFGQGASNTLSVWKPGDVAFEPSNDIVFDFVMTIAEHPNTIDFVALGESGEVLMQDRYYSVGGGTVFNNEELQQFRASKTDEQKDDRPYPFTSTKMLLEMSEKSRLSIADIMKANELSVMSEQELLGGLDRIWLIMQQSISRGVQESGELPGGLGVKRRATGLYEDLSNETAINSRHVANLNEWLLCYAMAVNEENAAGGRIVTSPTNGAAGVVPAVLKYHMEFHPNHGDEDVYKFLLTAAAVCSIIKHNASISGAEVGCQGEVGSASAMAAAGLCAVLGGTSAQIENAAEIALEHHLGLTCDPIKGLVQAPCIERNGLGAVKAYTAAQLALRGDGSHLVPLDSCIETMRQTGMDMSERYKETSQGGLAVNLPEC